MTIEDQNAKSYAEKLMDASRKLADEAFKAVCTKDSSDKEAIEVLVDLNTGKVKKVYE